MGVCGETAPRKRSPVWSGGYGSSDLQLPPAHRLFSSYTYSRRPSGSQSGPPARYGGQPSRGLFAQLPELAGMNTGLPTEAHARNKRERRLVRKKGLEPSRYCWRQPLKLVDLLCRCELPRILLTDPELKWTPRTHATTLFAQIRTRAGARLPPAPALTDDSCCRRSVVVRFGRPDPDASRLDGDDRALDECGAMRVDRRDRRRAVVSGVGCPPIEGCLDGEGL